MSVHSKQIVQEKVFIANEIPTGIVDGFNKDFVLNYVPIDDTVLVRLSGLVQVPGSGKDYLFSGQTISFIKAPKIGQEVAVSYFK